MIKILVPDLPTTEELVPYLDRIYASKVCCNSGELVQELEYQIEHRHDGNSIHCAAVSNGTTALELALRSLDLAPGSKIAVPSVTFVASGQAIVNAGLTPVILDVDPVTWQLTSEIVKQHNNDCGMVDAVMPVAAFGAPVDVAPWEEYSKRFGDMVVIDAAGALDKQVVSQHRGIITCFSLHGTKVVMAGEGGLVCGCKEHIEEVRRLSTFGEGGTNAKMSEYAAAVALASLARLDLRWQDRVIDRYTMQLPGVLAGGGSWSVRFSSTMLVVKLPFRSAYSAIFVQHRMQTAGVETKRWYAPYLHERQNSATRFAWDEPPVATSLSHRLLGLPFHKFLTDTDIDYVCKSLKEAIA